MYGKDLEGFSINSVIRIESAQTNYSHSIVAGGLELIS